MIARPAVRFCKFSFISILVLLLTASPIRTRATGPSPAAKDSKQNQALPLTLTSGDFDEDGVADLVAGYATPEGNILTLRPGYAGFPHFSPALFFEAPCQPEMLEAVDFNADGHTDLAMASLGEKTLYILPGNGGANFGQAEEFRLPARATALASGQLHGNNLMDLAVGAGRNLLIVPGDGSAIEQYNFSFTIVSIAIGDFTGEHGIGLALLSENGTVYLLQRSKRAKQETGKQSWHLTGNLFLPGSARLLLAAEIKDRSADGLLAIDPIEGQLHILTASGTDEVRPLDIASGVAAALPMQLNRDILSDLIILSKNRSEPILLMSDDSRSETDFEGNFAGDCTVMPIKIQETVGGNLKASDCRSQRRGSGFTADRYSFTGTQGQKIDITLESKDFDSYLYLIDPAGKVVAEDDDSGKGPGAKISFALKSTGKYTIEVTSFRANRLGHYHMKLAFNGATQPVLIGGNHKDTKGTKSL